LTQFNLDWGLLFVCFAVAPWIIRGTKNVEIADIETPKIGKKRELSVLVPPLKPEGDFTVPLHLQAIEDSRRNNLLLRQASIAASGDLGANLRAMVMSLDRIEIDLIADGAKFEQVQSLFSFYLPRAIAVLEAREHASANQNGAKIASLDAIIARLAIAFKNFALIVRAEETSSNEIDFEGLDKVLADEFGLENRIA